MNPLTSEICNNAHLVTSLQLGEDLQVDPVELVTGSHGLFSRESARRTLPVKGRAALRSTAFDRKCRDAPLIRHMHLGAPS